mgnify:CR=1 FL=1
MKRLGILTAISHHRWWIVTPALLEPETASRSRPLVAETTLLQERNAVSRTTPAQRRYVETFPIGVDAGVEHLTTQQALPAEKAECRASRILQPDGHHQTMTTWAAHLLTSLGWIELTEPAHPPDIHNRHVASPRSQGPVHVPTPASDTRKATVLVFRTNECSATERLWRRSGAETGESVARRRDQEARWIGQSAWLNTSCMHATPKGAVRSICI